MVSDSPVSCLTGLAVHQRSRSGPVAGVPGAPPLPRPRSAGPDRFGFASRSRNGSAPARASGGGAGALRHWYQEDALGAPMQLPNVSEFLEAGRPVGGDGADVGALGAHGRARRAEAPKDGHRHGDRRTVAVFAITAPTSRLNTSSPVWRIPPATEPGLGRSLQGATRWKLRTVSDFQVAAVFVVVRGLRGKEW